MPDLPFPLTRRRLLQGAAAGVLLPACGADPPAERPTVAALRWQNALAARPLDEARLAAILPAVRLNHAFFRAVRALEIPDAVEPAVRFHAESS